MFFSSLCVREQTRTQTGKSNMNMNSFLPTVCLLTNMFILKCEPVRSQSYLLLLCAQHKTHPPPPQKKKEEKKTNSPDSIGCDPQLPLLGHIYCGKVSFLVRVCNEILSPTKQSGCAIKDHLLIKLIFISRINVYSLSFAT